MIAKIIDSNTIEVYDLSQFDVSAIMHSGQVFRYFKNDNSYKLVVGKNYAEIFCDNYAVKIKCNDAQYFYNYFDLYTDYNIIKNELSVFEFLRPMIKLGGGIRILRSDFNEMVISFIISANNNIKRFTKTLNGLAQKYGEILDCGLYSFPTIKQLKNATEADFKVLGCGYRAAYLVKAVSQLSELNIESLLTLSDTELDKTLLSLSGVGPKVCACIKLFSVLHRLSTCPIDTWIKKALDKLSASERQALLNHKYAGIAQQYFFYYFQHLKLF